MRVTVKSVITYWDEISKRRKCQLPQCSISPRDSARQRSDVLQMGTHLNAEGTPNTTLSLFSGLACVLGVKRGGRLAVEKY